jgi:hypothetical protein
MRVPLMPLALSLAVGGLLYAAYQGNKRIVEAAAPHAAVASRAKRPDAPPSRAANTEASQDGDEQLDLSQLNERCAAIAEVVTAGIEAVESDVPLEEFLRRPLVAFVNDPALRTELELLARDLYGRPRGSPSGALRDELRGAHCE